MQAHQVHGPVHDEGRPGHVTCVLQKTDAAHQDHDHRQENDDRRYPGDDAIRDQACQFPHREHGGQERREGPEASGDPVLWILAEHEGERVDRYHHSQENRDAQVTMGEQAIQLGGVAHLRRVRQLGYLLNKPMKESIAEFHQQGRRVFS